MLTRKALYGILTARSQFNKKNNMNNKQDWIARLKAIASENYELGYGYQVFVECYDSRDWMELIEDCETFEGAEALMHRVAGIHTDRYQEARAEIL